MPPACRFAIPVRIVTIPAIPRRGVFLEMADFHDTDCRAGVTGSARRGTQLRDGDCVLIRTSCSQHYVGIGRGSRLPVKRGDPCGSGDGMKKPAKPSHKALI